ncbi:hypothetical protein [Celeribacter persicus]|uniref:Uncharacterized protein n=1 Tax=Celeribacter persicus TaxID=1651082 RepID=A0A2T5H5J9_9RHOB|nr:hypothetical protein [Celeribacter persicus]PTQ66844.1 hypothetical protein C8N42_12232 [Celeribacter persicus]
MDARRVRHQLTQTISTLGADGGRVIAAFSLGQGAEQDLPVLRVETDATQGAIARIAICCGVDQGV